MERTTRNDHLVYPGLRHIWRHILRPTILLLVVASCNGQVKTDPSGDTAKNVRATIVRTQGISSSAVTCALLDKDGNLWFGTKWFGLSMYDGKTFTTFSQENAGH